MPHRPLLAACFLLALVAVVGAQQPPAQDAAIVAKAKAIHEKVISLDSHVDIGGATYATPELDPGVRQPRLKCDLVKMKEGGLKGVFLAVFVAQRPTFDQTAYRNAYDQAIVKFEAVHRLTEKMHPDLAELATSPEDVERIARTGKRVILIGVENGYPLGEDLDNVRKFFDLGARYITLTHSGHNQVGDSSSDRNPPRNNGLSEFGKKVVSEMNRVGMMVDVSHIAASSYWDVIKLSKAPIIASHSGCSALNRVDRNLDDEQLKALAKNGGVIQVVALSSYLKAETPERAEAIRKLREELGISGRGGMGGGMGMGGGRGAGGQGGGRGQAGQAAPPQTPTPEQQAAQAERQKLMAVYQERMKEIDAKYPPQPVTIVDYVNHIDHAVKVAGIDHVGVGTDFDGGGGFQGFNDHSEALNVTIDLVRRGYSQEQIARIWGGNLLRVWREVRKVAQQEQAAGGRR